MGQIFMSTIQNYMREASKKLSETGKKTGLMVSMGEKESYIVPIFETFVVNHATTSKVSEKLMRAMHNSVYVAIDPDKESARIKKENTSPERQRADRKLRESPYMAAECIFKPSLVGKDSEALDGAILSVLSQCEVNFRRGLCNNIVLYGSVAFTGLSERLQLEIQKKFQGTIEVNVSSL
jgi:actin-related protein